jgi:hypothetical protein
MLSFGKSSKPALASTSKSPRAPYASGLSPTGNLVSAKSAKPSFYGPPLVSWQPTLGAAAYEVQWSSVRYPFTTAATPILTYGTSAILPLSAGTWYYRVRGLNLTLPAGARAMAWSNAQPIVVAKPKFKIVGGSTGTSSTMHTFDKGSYTLGLPKSWREFDTNGTGYLFMAVDPAMTNGVHASAGVSRITGRGRLTLAQWSQAIAAQIRKTEATWVGTAIVHEPSGAAARFTYQATSSGKHLTVVQYAFDSGARPYLLTFASTTSVSSRYAKVFAAAAASFSVS